MTVHLADQVTGATRDALRVLAVVERACDTFEAIDDAVTKPATTTSTSIGGSTSSAGGT